MLAYDRISLAHFNIQAAANAWSDSRLISSEQRDAICDRFPCGFYTPTFFIRVTLFLATWIALIAASGLVSLFLPLVYGSYSSAITATVLAGAVYWFLERIIVRERRFYRAGVDDALLYFALGNILAGIGGLLLAAGLTLPTSAYFLIPLPFLAWTLIRFADSLVAGAFFVCIIAFWFSFLLSQGTLGRTVLPFVIMVVAAPFVLLSDRLLQRKEFEPWHWNLVIFKGLGLATFYLGGNYLIVRELSVVLLDLQLQPGDDIPLALLFYGFTVVTPLAYAFQGIRQRDIAFIRLALLTAAFSIFTFQYYLEPVSYGLFTTVIGGLLVLTAIAVMHYLKQPVQGFTHRSLFRSQASLDAEAFLIAETMGRVPTGSTGGESTFGGGESGGAGAGRKY